MINAQQIVAFLPMFENLKFPEFAADYHEELIKLATFDLIDTGFIDDELYDLPEAEPLSSIFLRYGYESPYLITNIGLLILIIWTHILAFLLKLLLSICGIRWPWLQNHLVWSGSYRLFTESYFDLGILSIINILNANWSTENPSERVSLAWSLIFMSSVIVGPIVIHIGLCCSRKRWLDTDFQTKYGGIFADTRAYVVPEDKRWTMVFHPTLFYIRRLLFLVSVFGMKNLLFFQIVLPMAVSIAMVAYFHNARPHESPFARRLATIDECVVLALLTILMCLTDFFPEDSRNAAGKVYVGVSLTHLTLYLSMILVLNLIAYR